MSNAYDQFLLEDDDLLASVLEESLRHYNEVEVPLRSTDLGNIDKQNGVSKKVDSPSIVVDLCESPKKSTTVQSRLSHFFKKPINNTCYKETNNEVEKQSNIVCEESNALSEDNITNISSSPAIFYKESDANGFHLSSGSHYVYPSNFPIREYQMEIIKTALFHNTLVSLPTGLGKTFIAAVVMYNFYRWYPMGKIIFMAPTRPLVAQQVEACHSIMGIPKDMTFEMTGNIAPEQRYLAWKKYRVFFLTPQVLANDLSLNKCPSDMFKCVIVDEAHRATKNYAYSQVLKQLQDENRTIRIVGLSATPGTTTEAVLEVIQNLSISKLEFRTDESPDVAKYTNKKEIECISVKLSDAILNIRSQFLLVYDKYSRRLKQYRALSGNITNLTKFQLLGAKQKFLSSNMAREMPKPLVGCLINDFTICMSLSYALELLTVYGVKVFYLQSLELLENHKCLSNDADLQKILHGINRELKSQDLTWSHPKLFEMKKIVQDYFDVENTESNSKIIIFCQYRLVVVEVFELLKTFGFSVKPIMFVGQSLKEKGGLAQKKQLEVMSRFISGEFNVLIATSVAEEGLDIGEVDLIICLEANKSPIKFVQRLGRTGRKRSGKCITLLTEGKEQMKYNSSVSTSKKLVMKMLKNKSILSKLGKGGPRLIPKHINPQCLMIHVKPPENILPEKKKKGKRQAEDNILQYLEPNERLNEISEDLDVFQNNKDKLKRRSKKRETTELESNHDNLREIELNSEENFNFNYNTYDTNYNDLESNVTTVDLTGIDSNGVNSFCFVAEDNALREWQQSCKQANSIVINESFFKLFNLFTDVSKNIATNNNELVEFTPNINHEFNRKTSSSKLFKSQNTNNSYILNNTSLANSQSQFLDDCLFMSNNIDELSQLNSGNENKAINNKLYSTKDHNIDKKLTYQKNTEITNSENQLKSQVLNKHINSQSKEMVNEKTSFKKLAGSFNEQKNPIVNSNKVQIKNNIGPEKINVSSKQNYFDELFRPQKAEITGESSDGSENQKNSRMDLMEIDNNLQPYDESSTDVVDSVRPENFENDDGLALENINFEHLFKSQRADTYIEKYNSEIMNNKPSSCDLLESVNELTNSTVIGSRNATEYSINSSKCTKKVVEDEMFFVSAKKYKDWMVPGQSNNHTNNLNEPAIDRPMSPIICSGRYAQIESAVNQRSNYICREKDDRVFESQKTLKSATIYNQSPRNDNKSGSFDMNEPVKGQQANSYIEDYIVKATVSPSKTMAPADEPNKFDNSDDIISIDDSPEFFSCKLSKKKSTQKTLTNCFRTSDPEVIDLSTPPRPLASGVDQFISNVNKVSSEVKASTGNQLLDNEEDIDFLFANYCSDNENNGCNNIFTQKLQGGDNININIFTQKEQVGDYIFTPSKKTGDNRLPSSNAAGMLKDENSENHFIAIKKHLSMGAAANVKTNLSITPEITSTDCVNPAKTTAVPSYGNSMQLPYGVLKTCNLLKPSFCSLKRNTAAATAVAIRQQQAVIKPVATRPVTVKPGISPIQQPMSAVSNRSGPPQKFSQSTPKYNDTTIKTKQPRETVNLLTSSSSDSDVFVNHNGNDKTANRHRLVKKKPKPKLRKKLVFIDDEADVSYCGDTSAAMAAAVSRESSTDDDNSDNFDSSFIDDNPDQSEPSTSMKKQYLQSVKSQTNVHGVFKIPKLSTQHYNIDVYSQMVDRNDNSYEEDSFCVRDASDINTSSNTSAQQTSEERPTKQKKRKRIMSPQSTSDSDSPNQLNRNLQRKRAKFKMSLNFS